MLGEERLDRLAGPGRGSRRDRLLEPSHLGLEAAQPFLGPRHELPERLVPLGLDGLVEGREGRPARRQDAARVGLDEPLDDPQKRRLAGAVAADEAGDPSRVVLPGRSAEDGLRTEGLVDALEPVEHARRIPSPQETSRT